MPPESPRTEPPRTEPPTTGVPALTAYLVGNADEPVRVLRFANRDDASNIQYSLRKLIKAGLVRQVRSASKRDTSYEVTAEGARISARLVALRREYLMTTIGGLSDGDDQIAVLTRTLGLLTGIYDHGSRLMSVERHEG